MTFKEKLMQEHPEAIDSKYYGGCYGCPSNYGYMPEHSCRSWKCAECWNQEMPTKKQSNADKLRSMTDYELAKWLTKITDVAQSDAKVKCDYQWHEWLQEEVEE